ncbi:hypothetical protein [His 1 virus]|uniref:Uncharacterized protein ORF8 n=1 Tax=His1 virus (isolate Australia/Victoria) TaxID=654912 RepID=Y008_HIS1I|nr:hypothetical protein His1V_gp08 [His 1 virus]Q25BI7.1 RecName: Full=Uncharacterized protein ORF8 [His1 virus (isolate Victoria)]AAQ13721.1 hypothetical protein [His 1 virus]
MSPEITRETFENGPGEQTSLFHVDDCVKNHARLRKEYNLTKCPNCQRNIEKTPETADKSEQKALTDF